jgi:hypothetical protein
LKRFFRISGSILAVILLLLMVLWVLIQTPFIQKKTAQYAAYRLEKILGTRVEVEGMELGLLNRFSLEKVMVFDRQGDTLLSAGRLKLAVTDWFIWQDTTEVKYIGLHDVHVKLQRNDTAWNFAFLNEVFGRGEQNTATGEPIQVKLKIAEITNLRFERLDFWRGRFLYGGVKSLYVKGKTTNFKNGLVELESAELVGPEYRDLRMKGKWSTKDSLAFWKGIDSMDRLAKMQPILPDTDPFRLIVNNISIMEGNLQFYNRRKRLSTTGVFDERDIIITGIAGNATNLSITGDTIRAAVKLKANERSGFRIQSLATQFTMHPQLMEFADLDLVTNNSRVGPYYSMRYNTFDNMEYFLDSVQIVARIRNAKVSMEDIAVFAPDLAGIKQVGLLSGDAKGTVSDFVVKNVDLKTGKSHVTGTYAMKGLVDINHTVIDFTTRDTKIYLPDLEVWSPELKTLQQTPVANLGIIGFRGSFSGSPFDFFVKGNFATDAGSIDADLALKMNGEGRGYLSHIERAELNGAKLLGVPKLGRIIFGGEVKSNGFGVENPVDITGTLEEISYDRYTYRNLEVKSIFSDYLLDADMVVNDPNLRGNISTTLNFREKQQRYNAKGKVDYVNFYNLNLFGDSLLFRGDFDVDFAGNSIDDFLGYARFYNASVSNGRQPLSFDSLLIESTVDSGGNKLLTVRTNEAQAFVNGKFELSRLGDSFSLFLSRYYPTLIKAPAGNVPGQDFSFEIKTRKIEPFLRLFNRDIGGGEFASILGSLNTETNQLLVSGDVPSFRYGSMVLSDVNIRGNGSGNKLDIFGAAASFQLNEQISFPNAELKVATINDSTRITINTTTSGPLGNAAINADLFSQQEGFELRFNESSFIANKKKWIIEADGGFLLKNDILFSDGLVLVQEQQRIEAFTRPAEEGHWNDLFINLHQFNMGDWLQYFVTDPSLEGIVSGNTVINDPMGIARLESKLRVEQFYFNNDSIGLVNVDGRYDSKKEIVEALVKSGNPAYDFDALVNLNFKDSAAYPINSRVVLRNERLSVLKRYLTDVFEDIDGFANGELLVRGPFAKPAIVGNVQITNAIMRVDYTQCLYRVDTATLVFGENYIDFGSLTLKDEKGRTGMVEGRFYHRFFDSLNFNLRMRTEGMQVLNTSAGDNDLFYGTTVGKATMSLTGPLNNMQMRIAGTPTDSSWIAVLTEDSRTSGEADYIVFKEYGNEAEIQVDTSITNIHILLELTANPLCRVDVVLDELTGDIISATGNGNLTIRSGTADPTEMRGRFVVERGSYNYTFQSFIRKPFILEGDGNNFLEWNGDPYEANMNITATYVAKDISLRDLVSNENSAFALDQNARNYKGDVWVNALIKGKLSSPDIKFKIEFPPGSVMRNNITANDLLRRISEDESENLRQVTYLIVFRSFAPYKQGAGVRNPGADLAVNTISELVSGQMEKILTGVIQDLTRDKSLSVDLSTNFYNSSQTLGNVNAFSQYDRMNVDFNLNRTYFNSRVKVNLGSDFDLNVRNTATTGFQFLPDVSVEFILTSNRRLRAIIFKRDNLDISGRRNRAGASISYRKDFERLFGRKDEEALFILRPKEEEPAPQTIEN